MALTKESAKKNIKLYGLIMLLSGVTFLVPIISIFYKYTGLSTFEIILISNILTFGMRIFELPTSVLGDTFGRKKSLMASVICNFICTLFILFCPNLVGFCIAAAFQGLYYSFWSGTGQAFLEENLSKTGEKDKFGRIFGKFTFYGEFPAIITPVIASIILRFIPETGYTVLAVLDCISAISLVFLAFQLTETFEIKEKITSFKHAIKLNIDTGKNAIKEVFLTKNTRNFLIYRSLSYHVAFFDVLLLPILAEKGMVDWVSGIITTIFAIGSMFASKYAYKRGEKYGYNISWARSTIAEAICLIVAGLFFKSRIFLAIIYFIFSVFNGIIQPSWNHELIKLTNGKSIATTRSIIFACTALYMTFMKWILSYIEPNLALIILGIIMILANIIFAKTMLKSKIIKKTNESKM